MAMVANDMADAIIQGMKAANLKPDSKTINVDAALAFGKAFSNYVFENCQVKFKWVGVSPPPASLPDPIESFNGKVSGNTALIPYVDLPTFGIALKTLISSWMITPEDSSFMVNSTTFLPMLPTLTITKSEEKDPKKAMTFVCDLIIDNIKKSRGIVPAAGTHGAFTGSGTMDTIS